MTAGLSLLIVNNPRILCPVHKENTPSMVIYETHGKCFGCGAYIPIEQLDLRGLDVKTFKKDRTDFNFNESLVYVSNLPRATVRGLSLPVDSRYYYILWPNKDYYKKRAFIVDGGSKYLNPPGIPRPPFTPYTSKGATTLVIIEGELNALSLAEYRPAVDITSPGSASDLGTFLIKNRKTCLQYSRFVVIVDKDKTGVEAGLRLKHELLQISPYVKLIATDSDLNEQHINDKLKENVELYTRV